MINKNHNEYGSAHLITKPKEINNCNCIPDNNRRLKCNPGNILMHKKSLFGNKYYITEHPNNVLIYAISSSKYYQMIVKPTIDINSRSKTQPNMVINDVDGRIYSDINSTLKKRGYNTVIFNLSSKNLKSIHYNPLDLVTKLAYQGRIKPAEDICNQVADTIYDSKGQGKNSFFYTIASNLFNALTFYQIALHFNNHYHLFTNYKINSHPITINWIDKLAKNNQPKQLINLFNNLKVNFNKLNHKSNLNMGQRNYVVLLKVAIKNFKALKMTGDKTLSNVYATFLDGLKVYQSFSLSKLIDKTTPVFKHDLTKPVALFIITSKNTIEINQLATLLIEQISDVLISLSLKFRNYVKFSRGTQFVLDGISDLPKISDLGRNLSIGLSFKISYLLRFHSYEQIQLIYGKSQASVIIANCSLIYYVLSNSIETNQMISNAIGSQTITSVLNLNEKTKTKTYPLVSVKKLEHLKSGEVIILRTNNTGNNNSIPYPIFDTGKYALPIK